MPLSTPFINAKVICPYCGHPNNVRVRMDDLGKRIVLCDIEEGPGCDEYFVADIWLETTVTTFALVERKHPEAHNDRDSSTDHH